jgi:hypothetical protein
MPASTTHESILDDEYETLLLSDQGSPERNLIAAMLSRAIMDAALDDEADDAWAWMLGYGSRHSTGKGGWTFREACEILDIDPETLLRRVAARTRRGDDRQCPVETDANE